MVESVCQILIQPFIITKLIKEYPYLFLTIYRLYYF